MDIVSDKKFLRKQILEKVRLLSEEQRKTESIRVFNKLIQHPLWKNSKSVFLYASMPGEVDTWQIIEKGLIENKIIGLPYYDKMCDIYKPRLVRDLYRDLKIGKLGIKEPNDDCPEVPLEEFDLIIVPGVAFSRDGYRLGRGKGYYDKLLAWAKGRKCGICFECQFVEKLPTENHDVKMNYLITPSLIVEF